MLYRRVKGEEFKRIKLLTKTFHTDNLSSQIDERYEYAVTAYYQGNECESGYARSAYNGSMRFIEVNKSIVPQHLSVHNEGNEVTLYWQEATTALSYNVYRNGEKIAENLTEPTFVDNNVNSQQSYIYAVTGQTDYIESSLSNEASVDWTTLSEETVGNPSVTVYPNPTNGILTVENSLAAYGSMECRVYNTLGQEVMRQAGVAERLNLNLKSLPDGAYFVNVVTANENKTIKVVKIQ